MRRPLVVLALLLLGAAPPVRVIKLADRGVPAATPAENVALIQSAIDELQAANLAGTAWGKVVLPPCDVQIDRPIFLDGRGVGLEGEGKGISRLIGTTGHDVVVTGVQRRPNAPGVSPDLGPDHFVDIYSAGWLKGAVSGPAQRYAFRTKSDSHMAQQGGPLDTFPAGAKSLTVEIAMDLSRLRDPSGGYVKSSTASVCGLTEKGVPAPWEIVLSNDAYMLKVRSDSGKTVLVPFGRIPKDVGFVRVTAQIDLAAGCVLTWVDDRKVPNTARLPDDFAAFAANQHCPFGIGANSGTAGVVADYQGSASDITFAGLRVTLAPVYKADDSLTRLDGKPVADTRYFAMEAKSAGCLWLTDPPASIAKSRVAMALAPGFTGSTVYVLDNAGHGSNYASSSPGPIRHLSLVSAHAHGRGLAVGMTMGLRVEDCEVFGGRDGIGSLNLSSTYPVSITDCDLAGSDSPLYLFMASSVRIQRVTLPRQFRTGFRLVNSSGTIRDVFSPAWNTSDHYVRAVGSSFVLEDATFDNEAANGGAQLGAIYCLPGVEYPTSCRVSRTAFASYGGPLVVLDEIDRPDKLPLKFTISDCLDVLRGGLGSGRIDARGKRWQVTKDW